MTLETLTALGLSEEATLSLLDEIDQALASEFEKGKTEGESALNDYKHSLELDNALSSVGAKNSDLLKALINFDAVSFENGEITGLFEQIEKIKEENPFLFNEAAPCFTARSKANDKINKKSFEKMSYMERVKLFSKNPTLYNQLKG